MYEKSLIGYWVAGRGDWYGVGKICFDLGDNTVQTRYFDNYYTTELEGRINIVLCRRVWAD